MKKIRIMSIILLLLSTAAFAAFKIYEWTARDYVPPVISFPEGDLEISIEDDDEKLLEDVTAQDNRSGDVSDSLVVERVSEINYESERIVTYAAIDEKGNVGRAERTIKYVDYQNPWFWLTDSLRYKVGETVDILDRVRVESTLDGDLSDKIKYTLQNSSDEKTAGMRYVDLRVMDSAGSTINLRLPVELYDSSSEKIEVKLKDYLIYAGVNTSLDLLQYYEGASQEGTLQIEPYMDLTTPGVYYVDYIVTGETGMGKNRLVVVVY